MPLACADHQQSQPMLMEETAATGLDFRASSNGHEAWRSASTTASTLTSCASRGQISTTASSLAPVMPPEKRRRQDEPEHQHQQHQHQQQVIQGGMTGGQVQHQHQQPQSPHQWQSQQYMQVVVGLEERIGKPSFSHRDHPIKITNSNTTTVLPVSHNFH